MPLPISSSKTSSTNDRSIFSFRVLTNVDPKGSEYPPASAATDTSLREGGCNCKISRTPSTLFSPTSSAISARLLTGSPSALRRSVALNGVPFALVAGKTAVSWGGNRVTPSLTYFWALSQRGWKH